LGYHGQNCIFQLILFINQHLEDFMTNYIFSLFMIFSALEVLAQTPTDIFGRDNSSSLAPAPSAGNTAAPNLISRERNVGSSTSSGSSAPATLTNETRDAAPTFLRDGYEGTNRYGWQALGGGSFGTGTGQGFGAAPRLGYTFRNNLYFGAALSLNLGTLNQASPLNPNGVVQTQSSFGGIQFGYEIPIRISSLTIVNRIYGGLGTVFVNTGDIREVPNATRSASFNQMPAQGFNLFGEMGNMIFLPVSQFMMLNNFFIGIDARYIMFANASGFAVGPALGFRVF
jgi:hypothetical protein